MPAPFSTILFDWRGTLFHDEPDADWIRAAAYSIGRAIDDDALASMMQAISSTADHPDAVAARETADLSSQESERSTMVHFGLAGIDQELARAIWSRDGTLGTSFPYPDTARVLRELKARGCRIGIISDIHYHLYEHFAHYDLDQFVDAYVLSFEVGCQKPDQRIFVAALDALQTTTPDALMVGDRASRDGGAAAAGIATIILPTVPAFAERGLASIVSLAGQR